jgi:PAS domain S-box-containing protein
MTMRPKSPPPEDELARLREQIEVLRIEKNNLATNLEQASQELKKHQQLFDHSSDALMILNHSALVTDCNTTCVNLFGWKSKDDIRGKSFYDFIPSHNKESLRLMIDSGLHHKSEVPIETVFLKNNESKIQALLSFSNQGMANKALVAIIKDLTPMVKIQEDASKQIEVLAKLSIFNNEIKQAHTSRELKLSLCSQCVLLTQACEVWFLSQEAHNMAELIFYSPHGISTRHIEVDNSFYIQTLKFLNQPQDVYVFENQNLIHLPGEKANKHITFQYIIGTHLRTGNWTLLGLNYDHLPIAEKNGDIDFLRNIFSLIFSSLENLNTYEKIIENENRFRAIIENSDNVICVLNEDLKYTYVSPNITKYNISDNLLLGHKVGHLIHPDDKHKYIEAIQYIIDHKNESVTLPAIRTGKKGDTISFSDVHLTNMLHIKGVEGLVVTFRDINERMAYENKLRQSEEKFRNIFNLGNDPIYITDLNGNFLEVNDVATDRTGLTKEEFLSTNLKYIASTIAPQRVASFIDEIIQKGSATAEDSFVNKYGNYLFFEINGKLIDYNNTQALLLRTINVTELKNIEHRILETIIKTEERERARFARELHDGIGPYLSAIKFFLQTLTLENNEESRATINHKALESIDETIRSIKEISNNLSPRVLTHFGIIAALKALIKKVTESHVTIDIQSNIEGIRFDENMEINIFRIVTELVNNSLKHAKANQLNISLMLNNNQLTITYSDNGIGFNFHKKYALGKGSGLYNIANRVKSLHGTCDFTTSVDKGLFFKAIFKI